MMLQKSPNQLMVLALLAGLFTGAASSGLMQNLFPGGHNPGGDRFGIQTHLTLSAGVAFAILAPLALHWLLRLPKSALIACGLASIGGMFLASEAAFWTFVATDDTKNVIPAYLAGSVVGSTILSGAIVWAGRLRNVGRVIGHCVAWPTLWAALIGSYITMNDAQKLLEWPNDMLLFCGWQAAFLGALTWALRD